MIVEIYFDIFPWTKSILDIFPTISPGPMSDGLIRYRVKVDIPDLPNFNNELFPREVKKITEVK